MQASSTNASASGSGLATDARVLWAAGATALAAAGLGVYCLYSTQSPAAEQQPRRRRSWRLQLPAWALRGSLAGGGGDDDDADDDDDNVHLGGRLLPALAVLQGAAAPHQQHRRAGVVANGVAAEEEGDEEASPGGNGPAHGRGWREQLLQDGADDVEAPHEYKDPISLEVMRDPVVLCATGQVYDYTTLRDWFRMGNRLCPKTNIEVYDVQLTRLPWLKSRIQDWRQLHGLPPPDATDPYERLARLHPTLGQWLSMIRNDTGDKRTAAVADIYEVLRQWDASIAAHQSGAEDPNAAAAAAVGAAAAGGAANPGGGAGGGAAADGEEEEAEEVVDPNVAAVGAEVAVAAVAAATQQAREANNGGGAGGGGGAGPAAAPDRAAAARALLRLHKAVRGYVLDDMVWMLRYGDPYLQGVAASVLAYCDAPGEVAWLAATAAVPSVQLLLSTNRYASQAACRLLYNLARAGDVARRTLIAAGAVPAMIGLLSLDRDDYGYCRDRAAATLALLVRDAEARGQVLRYGLPHLLAIIRSGEDRWEMRDAATLLLKLGLAVEDLRPHSLTHEQLVGYWCCSRAWLEGAVQDVAQGYAPDEMSARQAMLQLQVQRMFDPHALVEYLSGQDADITFHLEHGEDEDGDAAAAADNQEDHADGDGEVPREEENEVDEFEMVLEMVVDHFEDGEEEGEEQDAEEEEEDPQRGGAGGEQQAAGNADPAAPPMAAVVNLGAGRVLGVAAQALAPAAAGLAGVEDRVGDASQADSGGVAGRPRQVVQQQQQLGQRPAQQDDQQQQAPPPGVGQGPAPPSGLGGGLPPRRRT